MYYERREKEEVYMETATKAVKLKQVQLLLPPDMHRLVKVSAAAADLTITQWITQAITQQLERVAAGATLHLARGEQGTGEQQEKS